MQYHQFIYYFLGVTSFIFLTNTTAFAQNVLSENSPEYQKIEKVYQKIQQAAGDFRRDLPRLVLMERVSRVASYRSSDNVLIIEKKAFDVCESMGKDSESALAFLLGHELTHFYQQHDWEEAGFGSTFLIDKDIFMRHVHHEAEADLYGAFVAYVAGYNTLNIISPFLDKLYHVYKLEAKMVNYPSLKERKEVASKTKEQVQDLINIYDNANYFAAIGWHAQAIYCYEHILKFLKTKELYNNMGMALLAMAIQQQSADTYWYPIEVDLDNVLRGWSEKTQTELLGIATEYFEKALVFDATYFEACLNLAIVYDLQKKYDRVVVKLGLAEKYAISVIQKANVAILQGILFAHQHNKKAAVDSFEKAHKYTINSGVRSLVAHNKEVLKEGKSTLATEPMIRMEDMLDGVPLLESIPIHFQQSLVFSQGVMGEAKIHFNKYTNSKLVCLETKLPFDLQQTYFALQRSNSLATKKGVRAGTTTTTLRTIYDKFQAPKTVYYSAGYFLIYRSLGLIFKVNNQEIVEEWALFLSY
jgi:tetratricopeptide (TPR) repeat protein